MKKFYFSLLCFLIVHITALGQTIQDLMQRTDISFTEINNKAQKHFDSVGTGRGTGYKIFQRWAYERQFHIDKNGFYVDPNIEAAKFKAANSTIQARSTATNWTEIGPYNYAPGAGWNPGTGRVNAIVVDKNNDQIIYVATPSGGIWKTSNGGANWIPLTDNNTLTIEVYALVMNPQNSNTLYASTNNGGIWKTHDAGSNWTYMSSTSSFGRLQGLSINPVDTNNIFAAGVSSTGLHRIFRSVNAGATWTTTFQGTLSNGLGVSVEDIVFHPTNTNIIYAAGQRYLRSTDNGQTWTPDPNFPNGVGRMRLAVTPANPNYVYIVQAAASNFGKMFRSTNAGISFTTMVTGNPANGTNYFGYETDGTGTYGQAWYDMALTVSPVNPDEIDIGGIICWKSTNGGSSFVCKTSWDVPTSFAYNHADVHNLYWVNGKMYAATDGGIYKSNDGGNSWIDISTGLGIQQIYRAASSHNYATPLTVGAQDNGSTVLTANGWKSWLGADGMEGAISNSNPLKMYGTAQNGILYRSDDGGATRIYIGRPNAGNWVTPIAVHPTNDNIVYGGWNGFFKYDNVTNTFTNLAPGVITSLVHDFAISKSDPNRIYVVVNSNLLGTIIYKTTDGGNTWNITPHPFGPGYTTSFPYTIYDIAISPIDPDKYWIGTIDGVYCSYDGGNTYRYTDYSLPVNIPVRSIVIDDLPSQGVYCSIGGNVYYHDKNDTVWVNYTANLPRVAINELDINYAAGKLRAAFYGRGVWELPIETSYNVCVTPSGLSTNSITNNSANATWNTVNNVPDYTVEIRPVGGVWQTVGTTNTNTFNFTGLLPATTYEWRVRSNCSATNNSIFVQSQFTTLANICSEPTMPSSTNVTSTAAFLQWDAMPNAIEYTVQYKVGGSATWQTTVTTNTNNYTITNLQPGTIYEWRVNTHCGNNNSSSYTYILEFTTTQLPCNAPTGLTASNITTNSATLSWQPVNGAVNYTVEYKSGNSNWAFAANVTGNNYILTGLQNSTLYEWRVRSNCSVNSSSANVQDQFTTATPPCNTPTGLTTTHITTNSATLNWQPVSGALDYTVEYKTGNGNWILAATVANPIYNLIALQNNTLYEWRVRSNCSVSNSSNFVQSQFTTQAVAIACVAPSNLTVNNVQGSSATIQWSAVNGAIHYVLQYRNINTSNWTTITNITSSSYTLNNLTSFTTYQYRVATVCAGSNSAYSSIQQFTTACTSSGINTNEWISYFSMGSIARTSGAEPGGYVATGLQTNLTIGSTNITQVRAGYSNAAIKENFAIYLDIDRNGDFNGPNERIFGVALINSTNLRTYNINIPATALPGLTTMRIVLMRQVSGILMSPCTNGFQGETEDYLVNLTQPTPIATPNTTQYDDKISFSKIVQVSPNPATTNLTFRWKGQTEKYNYQLTDANGKILRNGNVANNNLYSISVTDLASGVYYLKVFTSKGEIEIKKVIIQK